MSVTYLFVLQDGAQLCEENEADLMDAGPSGRQAHSASQASAPQRKKSAKKKSKL